MVIGVNRPTRSYTYEDGTSGFEDGTFGDEDETFGDEDGTSGDEDGTFGDEDETSGDEDGKIFHLPEGFRQQVKGCIGGCR
ncbi:MAG: hypothetical protein LBT48_04250 [Prevotellaceae bacterium]|nr:hypothetical protein [Prevotellaceae bacterium]